RPMKAPFPLANWKQQLVAAAVAALAAAVTALLQPGQPENPAAPPPDEKEPVLPIRHEADPPRSFGWIDDSAAVRACSAGLPVASSRDTEAFAARYDGPDDVFLWDACRKVTGDLLPPRDQKSVGACVGFGTASAIEHLLCVQIAMGSSEEYRDLAQEVIYGG